MKNPARPIFLVFLLALLPAAARAQAYPAKDLLTTGTTILGEPIRYPTTGPARVTASIVTIAPGADTVFHRHPAPLVAYVLTGELTVDYGSHGQRVYRKGDAFVEAMDVTHRGMNLGTETVSLLAIYIGAEGTANVALEK
ncbi:MAG: cupin domain-containing protein [Rhodocyclaceae bacterium]|nr:cupin domain-containing protein [Rhodocyclaceae bacterium]